MLCDRSSIAAVAPTLAALLGVPPPRDGSAEPLAAVMDGAERVLGVPRVDRALVFCPDALGEHLHGPFADGWHFLEAPGTVAVRLRAELPPKTPVCFASMFTGAPPEVHGIRQYEKPVLICDTLFDTLVRAGRRVAIVAVADSSIATIFKGRLIDYFDEAYDTEVVARAETVVAAGMHDLVLAYVQAYDDALHETEPFSEHATAAFRDHLAAWQLLFAATERHWAGSHRVAVFAPDHGAHRDSESGRGDHGLPIPDDLAVTHAFAFGRAAASSPR